MKFHQVEFTRTLQRMDRKCDQDSEGYNMTHVITHYAQWDIGIMLYWTFGDWVFKHVLLQSRAFVFFWFSELPECVWRRDAAFLP